MTEAVHRIREMICTDDRTREMLWLDSWQQTQNLTEQLCNLTTGEFQELIDDVSADLDQTKLYTQLTECLDHQLRYFNPDKLNRERFQKAMDAVGLRFIYFYTRNRGDLGLYCY